MFFGGGISQCRYMKGDPFFFPFFFDKHLPHFITHLSSTEALLKKWLLEVRGKERRLSLLQNQKTR
jgi:hypothetical protein